MYIFFSYLLVWLLYSINISTFLPVIGAVYIIEKCLIPDISSLAFTLIFTVSPGFTSVLSTFKLSTSIVGGFISELILPTLFFIIISSANTNKFFVLIIKIDNINNTLIIFFNFFT